jgi:hypothetical protein
MRCGECGSKDIELKDVRGRTFPFKELAPVECLLPLKLHVCNQCSNIIVRADDVDKIDKALEESLRKKVLV